MFDVDLLGLTITERSAGSAAGYVELCGRLDADSVWLIGGWAARGWDEQTSGTVRLHLAGMSLAGNATTCFFNRDDLADGAVGFVLLLRCGSPVGQLTKPPGAAVPRAGSAGTLLEMTVELADTTLRLMPASAALPLDEAELRSEAGRLAGRLASERARAQLGNWLNRPGFTGVDTLATAGSAVRLEVEAVLPAPPADLVLIGWLDDPAECIAALQIRCGDRQRTFDATTWVRLPRRDVQENLAADAEDFHLDRGFLAFFPGIRAPGAPLYLQIEFTDGTLAYRPVPPPGRAGLAAMQLVLGAFHLRQQTLSRAMAQVIGPAVAALNEGWLSPRPRVQDRSFGPPPAAVRCSVIIRLCERADALEWQLALLSEAGYPDVEFLFVLDDPNLRDRVEERCETCFARFGVPFRLLLLDCFVGQGPADNIAAAHARGETLCFLSPAAIPDEVGWLDRLLETLEQPASPGVGTIGAVGGRVRSCRGEGVADADGGGARAVGTNGHATKGRIIDALLLSRDCLVVRRAVFRELGGFHEVYAISGYADEDLCLKLRWAGLRCVERTDVVLVRLDWRADPAALWRGNLALYNAWQRDRRWPQAAAPCARPLLA